MTVKTDIIINGCNINQGHKPAGVQVTEILDNNGHRTGKYEIRTLYPKSSLPKDFDPTITFTGSYDGDKYCLLLTDTRLTCKFENFTFRGNGAAHFNNSNENVTTVNQQQAKNGYATWALQKLIPVIDAQVEPVWGQLLDGTDPKPHVVDGNCDCFPERFWLRRQQIRQ